MSGCTPRSHRVGFTRFNVGPLIKLKKAPRQTVLIRAANLLMPDDRSVRGDVIWQGRF